MSGEDPPPPPGEAAERAAERRRDHLLRVRLLTVALIALVVAIADQATKLLVRATLERGEDIPLVPGFGLTRTRNEGIAFGLFPGNPELIGALTIVALVAITVAVARVAPQSRAVAIGGGMLIGGSVGNLIDRIGRGGVTDFLDPVAWPAFNVADMGIVCGVALIVLGLAFLGDP